MKKDEKGFTLIEMMIAVAIVGILSVVAFSAYNKYIYNSKFIEATSVLTNVKNKAEQYFQDNNSYTNLCSASSITSAISSTNNFSYTCVSNSDTFTFSANGTKTMSGFTFTINQNSEKKTTAVKSGYNAGNCWIKDDTGC